MGTRACACVLSGLVIGPLVSAPVAARDSVPPSPGLESLEAEAPAARLVVRVRPGVVPAPGPILTFTGPGPTNGQSEACEHALHARGALGIRRAVEARNVELGSRLGLDRYYVIDLDGGADAGGLAEALLGLTDLIESAEPDVATRAVQGITDIDTETDSGLQLPDDPLFGEQWALENTGQSIRGSKGDSDADIDATSAWVLARGSPDVIVAVLDSGISYSHPDLAGQFLDGYNFTSGNTGDLDDSWVSHGTHIAGVIAARWGNAEGIAGIAPDCRILPVRIVNRFSWTFEEWLAQGVVWATDQGASVINVSLGFPSASPLHRAAIQYAHESDVVICASSGNIGSDPIGFPARLPETIAVGATDNLDRVTGFTSIGPELTLCAPGRDICSAWDTGTQPNTYDYRSGTSFACPQVAGVAALVRSINPELSNADVRRILAATCDDLGVPGPDDESGWGRLNAGAAVALAASYPGGAGATCVADFNADGMVDFTDIQLFLTALSQGLPVADRNHDGLIDFFDVQHYLLEYYDGCPQTLREP